MPSPAHTARHALDKLESAGVITGVEMRHIASLSPFALLREWHIAIDTKNGRHDYTLAGGQIAYGKGLSLDDARASYAMEIVERCSAFAGFGPTGTTGYKKTHNLTHSTFSDLASSGIKALDPNKLSLEVPYADEPLWWIQAQTLEDGRLGPILIPAQCVFLFCNLDETSLFSGLGSIGLAAGNSMEEARLRALFEAIERDCEAISPYLPSRCFTLMADDPEIATLLAKYRARKIFVQFQDMTPAFGVPCYTCFVIAPDAAIIKGSGAHLDGRRALVAALTETPWPYPKGPPSAPFPGKLPMIKFEDLPDYSSGNTACDLQLLETLLSENGYNPVYVDLTRKDLGIPVVRALVPGLELMADFDRFSRVSPRLFANYRQIPVPYDRRA
jgi:YcaO-like protein with predicted kinase domain